MTIKKRLARSNIVMLVIPILTAAVLVLLGEFGYLTRCRGANRKRTPRIQADAGNFCRCQGVTLLAGLAIGVLAGNVCLKNLIARPRPCWLDDSVFMLISVPTDYSFPSGHTLASTIGATVLTKTNRKFGWAAIPAAIIIAFFRLYLFVHFPSDIAGRCGAGRRHRRVGIPCGGTALTRVTSPLPQTPKP